ncbi:hypothetical protein [Actinacidiphila guanduensis]|uniref:Uncharacterized protein n=1 Tax=Actinacidiphila guanduensis TaxID=310781 RepID=A0A1H0E122_9ACTN|nr:hypothetical protein [Actinacidiphila guanduensis]SDN75973.1 hypothetical protein SAMN05216259_105429 [Actinacidiphila guanduensis]
METSPRDVGLDVMNLYEKAGERPDAPVPDAPVPGALVESLRRVAAHEEADPAAGAPAAFNSAL